MASGMVKALSFEIRKVNFAYTVSAGGTAQTNLKTLIDADLPSGYSCLGIVGYTSNNPNCFFTSLRYVNHTYAMQIRNTASSQVSQTANIYYLAAKY